jgi:hypothetical protein
MFRHAAAVAVVLCLTPSWLGAQGATLTVGAAPADVHKAPSTGSPVIGQARRGTVLNVTRELGSWVKVTWPDAPEGAYVHVSMGSPARASASPSNGVPQFIPPLSAATRVPAPAPATVRDEVSRIDQRLGSGEPAEMVGVNPATHVVGFGGLIGRSASGFGASARAWRRNLIGFQLQAARYTVASAVRPGGLTSLHLAPSVLYSLPDRVTDYLWVRPYVGTGIHLRRQTLTGSAAPAALVAGSASRTGIGAQAFGGGELTFSAMPPFALSADVGYQWSRMPVEGFRIGGVGLTVSGHWYLR